MSSNNFLVGVVVVMALAVGFLFSATGVISYGKASGTTHYQHESFLQGFSAGGRDQFSVDNDGDIRLTKSTFCMNFYATSTATLVKMVASSTATIEGTDGVMVMLYGSC